MEIKKKMLSLHFGIFFRKIMKFTVKEIAEAIGGTIEGNADAVITKFSKIEQGEE
jgi:hypothetical protein